MHWTHTHTDNAFIRMSLIVLLFKAFLKWNNVFAVVAIAGLLLYHRDNVFLFKMVTVIVGPNENKTMDNFRNNNFNIISFRFQSF